MANLSTIISSKLPEHIRENPAYERFITFLTYYYMSLENSAEYLTDTDGDYVLDDEGERIKIDKGAIHYADNVLEFIDVDTIDEAFITNLLADLSVPENENSETSSLRLLIRLWRNFIKNKGNDRSFQFLFKIVFGADIEIYYPKEQLLKTSVGNWRENQYIHTEFIDNDDLIGETVKGATSGTTAVIDRTTSRTLAGRTITTLYVEQIRGTFALDEKVTIGADTTEYTAYPTIRQIVITDGGSGFVVGEKIAITFGGEATGFLGTVTELDNGAVRYIDIIEGGIVDNYNDTVELDTSGGSGEDLTADVTVATLGRTRGEYLDNQGQLSNRYVLQDSDFYQDYSYVIKSPFNLDTYDKITSKVIHPTGYKFFGEVLVVEVLDYDTFFSIVEPEVIRRALIGKRIPSYLGFGIVSYTDQTGQQTGTFDADARAYTGDIHTQIDSTTALDEEGNVVNKADYTYEIDYFGEGTAGYVRIPLSELATRTINTLDEPLYIFDGNTLGRSSINTETIST